MFVFSASVWLALFCGLLIEDEMCGDSQRDRERDADDALLFIRQSFRFVSLRILVIFHDNLGPAA